MMASSALLFFVDITFFKEGELASSEGSSSRKGLEEGVLFVGRVWWGKLEGLGEDGVEKGKGTSK